MDLLAISAAAALFITILAVAQAFVGTPVGVQVRGRLQGVIAGTPGMIGQAGAVEALRPRGSVKGGLQAFSGAWLKRMERDLRLADSNLQPSDLITGRIALAGAGFVLSFMFLSSPWGLIVGLAGGVLGFMLPQFWIGHRKSQRASLLISQLPDALTFIANSLKSGFGMMQALSAASEQMKHPIATELGTTVHETNVGSSMEEAFRNLSERCENYDIDLVVTAILIQRQAGGNLAEILENVADTMRERARIRAEIQTLTAQQQLTGIVIALLPVFVGGMFMVVSPEYISVLFTDTIGRVMLIAAATLEAVGVFVIKRILAIEV